MGKIKDFLKKILRKNKELSKEEEQELIKAIYKKIKET